MRELLNLLATKAYQWSDEGFILASGKKSNEYLDCRQALSLPQSLLEIGRLFHSHLAPQVQAVGGLTMGADPIAHMTAAVSYETAQPVSWFCVRKEQKKHGKKKLIEGVVESGDLVTIVDDVVTTGGSTIKAIKAAEEFGLIIRQVLILVDRENYGMDNIRDHLDFSVPVRAMFKKSEIRQHWELLQENGEKV
jgi:orotate phosphoribosyltransferase